MFTNRYRWFSERLAFALVLLLAIFGTVSPRLARGTESEQLATDDVTLSLVSARDHIEGSFTTFQSVYADRERIYLAAFQQGRLFVLERNRAANFPLLQIVQDTTAALSAVRGDDQFVYVTSRDGILRVYAKEQTLRLVASVKLAFGLSSLDLFSDKLYVGVGQAKVTVDDDHLYLVSFNPGEIAFEVDKRTLTKGLKYGKTFESRTTVVFDRRTGERVAGIPNQLRPVPYSSTWYADDEILAETDIGCCGPGINLYDPDQLVLDGFVPAPVANTVERRDRWLIAGTEAGTVDVFDLGRDPIQRVETIDLRRLTGHTGSADIEIRSLWTDDVDDLIFAASSWGNDESRGPSLPSFFVLELAGDETAQVKVTIDIKPGGNGNAINPSSRGVIPVAVLTTDSFDATVIDPMSVRFGPADAREAHRQGHIEDVNGDGTPDLVLHFSLPETGIVAGDRRACLRGKTTTGQHIRGCELIRTDR